MCDAPNIRTALYPQPLQQATREPMCTWLHARFGLR